MAEKAVHPERPMYIERVEITYRNDPSDANPKIMILAYNGRPTKPVDTLVFSRQQVGRLRQGWRKVKWRHSSEFTREDRDTGSSGRAAPMNNHCVWWHEADCMWKSFCTE